MFIQIKPNTYIDHTDILVVEKSTRFHIGLTDTDEWTILYRDITKDKKYDTFTCSHHDAKMILLCLNSNHISDLAKYLDGMHGTTIER